MTGREVTLSELLEQWPDLCRDDPPPTTLREERAFEIPRRRLPVKLAAALNTLGHDAVHVSDLNLLGALDWTSRTTFGGRDRSPWCDGGVMTGDEQTAAYRFGDSGIAL